MTLSACCESFCTKTLGFELPVTFPGILIDRRFSRIATKIKAPYAENQGRIDTLRKSAQLAYKLEPDAIVAQNRRSKTISYQMSNSTDAEMLDKDSSS